LRSPSHLSFLVTKERERLSERARRAVALQPDVLNLFGNPPSIPFGITVSKTEVVDDDRVRPYMMCENSQTHEKRAMRHADGHVSLCSHSFAGRRLPKSVLPLLCGPLANLMRLSLAPCRRATQGGRPSGDFAAGAGEENMLCSIASGPCVATGRLRHRRAPSRNA
jgi:hypothetical protein